jgi:hypothetical protein
VVDTAESIGAALGHVAARLEAWKKQRAAIASDIHALTKSAQAMLHELGVPVTSKAAPTRKGGRPKGYRTSDETRKKLREAWQRRRADAAVSGAEQTKPADVRAVIRSSEGRKWTARQRGRG